jgi:outer membrane protein TolC
MKKFYLTLAVIVLGAVTVRAQEPLRLTLAQAIEQAVTGNRDLANSRLSIETSDAQVDEAYSAALPSVGLNARYTQNIKKQVFYFPGADGVTRPIEIGQNMDIAADLTINQVLYSSALGTAVEAAKTYQGISRQQLRARTSDIVLSVRRAYYAAQLAREVLHVNETVLSNSEENFRTTTALYKAGLRPEFDAIRSEVQVANQQPAVVQARDNYQLALDNMRVLLGLSEGQQIEIVDPLVRPASLEVVEPTVAEAQKILEENNPTLQALSLSREVNKEMIDIRRADYLPTVSAFGTLRLASAADKPADLDLHTIAFAGINVSLSLFNGFRTDAQIKQAEIELAQSDQTYAQVSAALKTQLESTIRRISSARQRIGVSDKTIQQAEKGYRIATTSYKAGTSTQLQINDADLALAQAKLNQLNAVFDYNVALAELEQLLGERVRMTSDGNNVLYSSR